MLKTKIIEKYYPPKKTLELILNKFKDNNIELSLITKNNKYIDTNISWDKAYDILSTMSYK